LGEFDARVFRISFSGELSFEVAVPASQGLAFWDALMAAGEAHGITPYGTEALHVMRAEKGFIMIGDETDGTVIPQDLGLTGRSRRRRTITSASARRNGTHMTDPGRWKLVGLETLDGSVLPDGAYAIAEGENANGQRNTQGRVTSTYYSPTLGKGIAMGLVLNGPDRMGEVIEFARTAKRPGGQAAHGRARASSTRSSTTPRGRSRMSEIAVSALAGRTAEGLVEVREMGLAGHGEPARRPVEGRGRGEEGHRREMPGHAGRQRGQGRTVAWMSPDELLILCDHGAADGYRGGARRGAEGQHHLAVNVSDARAMFIAHR
jgi:sarcosine oxidase gamma subunit